MQKTGQRLTMAVVYLAAAICSQQSLAEDGLLVKVPAVYEPGAPVPQRIQQECALESLLGNHVFQKVSERFPGTLQLRDSNIEGTQVLTVTILNVTGFGGGGWSGPKTITLRADLTKEGRVIHTAVKHRASRGGVFGGVMGTCAILERVTQALGSDVAKWLAAVTLGKPEVQPDTSSSRDQEDAPQINNTGA